ncbi:MAG TPA: pyruvate kinase [Thermoanaerobaculia bacterium]|nr:pyruvate kinase [Thermoanaerobaculia bacterium]
MEPAERRAKIVATVGPASAEEKVLRRLLRAGVDVVRLNASHGTREQHRELVERVHRLGAEGGRQVGVMLDLMGPRYRLGELADPVRLRKGQQVTLGADKGADLPVSDPHLLGYVRAGERLLIDNGLVELRVERKVRRRLQARVVSAGTVSSRKGINLPDSELPFTISEKDRDDLEMAVHAGADFLAASYVGSARDVEAIRKLVVAAGGDLPIVAKLERSRAVEHLEEIVLAADAVMVARGDLGVEIELHQVPVIQKRIIETGWRHGKSVIVATQMLESMMEHPRPTRAESSDIANAVFDGADALMLSGETAAGRYPVESVVTMDRIVREAERHQRSRDTGLQGGLVHGPYDVEPASLPGTLEIPETISAAAVLSARQLGAVRIVALTKGGFTARRLAMRRPSTPVLAFTQDVTTARRLQLVWGVRPFLMTGDVKHHDEVVGLVDRCLLAAKLARPGDCIAILMGDPIQERPPTNLLRLHRVRAES